MRNVPAGIVSLLEEEDTFAGCDNCDSCDCDSGGSGPCDAPTDGGCVASDGGSDWGDPNQ